MNRSFYIILIPALLVVAGYLAVFRTLGMASGTPRLMIVTAIFFGAMYGMSRMASRRTKFW